MSLSLYKQLLSGEKALAVVGLGYVGMPLAVAFAKKLTVIGFDIDAEKIKQYMQGQDPTHEVGNKAVAQSTVQFTSNEDDLKRAGFFVITVPTPIHQNHTPDLSFVEGASRAVGRNLTKGSVVVLESTVYPGVTENVCVPILEKESGLTCGRGFKVGYSPERINPGDKVHRLETICKIVSGIDRESLEEIKKVYDLVIEAGTYPVSSIKTAEAIKVAENSQRDINIAFMNELAMVFDRMGIDTGEVVDGMNTKWNALGFRPGLVGGHCIGVDSYYFTHAAEGLGYHSRMILNGRRVNDGMGAYVADAAVKKMIAAGKDVSKSKVVILGLTFKENCPDIRNSRVEDIIVGLQGYGISPVVVDPWADRQKVLRTYHVELKTLDEVKNADCVIVAVAHREFRELPLDELAALYKSGGQAEKLLIDVKGLYPIDELKAKGFTYWRL